MMILILHADRVSNSVNFRPGGAEADGAIRAIYTIDGLIHDHHLFFLFCLFHMYTHARCTLCTQANAAWPFKAETPHPFSLLT